MMRRLKNYLVNEGAKLLILVLWLGINAILFYFTFIYYYYGPQFYYLHEMLGYGLCISRATAACINLNACVILLPMCRSFLRIIRGFPWVCRQCRRLMDKSKSFHIACGYMLCLMSAIHCGAHAFNAVNFSAYFNPRFLGINVAAFAHQNPVVVVVTSVPGVSGLLMVACLITIAVTASSPLRRVSYRRFWKAHHLFILFYALLLIHACSGILKYQTNIKEHLPGCFIKYGLNGTNSTTIFPVPEAEFRDWEMNGASEPEGSGEYFNLVSKPEAEFHNPVPEFYNPQPEHRHPMPEKAHFPMPEAEHHPMPEGKPEPGMQPCDQPEPKFKSCPTEAWMWMSVPLLFYLLERISRYIGYSNTPLDIVSIKEHPHDVIEIEFYQKDFKAKPGQSIWLRCPDISFVETHPFTLTSLPTKDKPNFTIHMLALGEWTMKARNLLFEKYSEITSRYTEKPVSLNSRREQSCLLDMSAVDTDEQSSSHITNFSQTEYNKREMNFKTRDHYDFDIIHPEERCLSRKQKNSYKPNRHRVKFYAHGPNGSAMQDVFRYNVSLCIAGGIGITPFAAVLNTILRQKDTIENSKLRRFYLIWICKKVESFEWFVDIINAVNKQLWDANRPDLLNVYLHVTSPVIDEQVSLQEIGIERCRLQKGRPIFKDMFKELSIRHQKSSIGVFCCGPSSLNNAVRKQCVQSNTGKGVKFIFNKESF